MTASTVTAEEAKALRLVLRDKLKTLRQKLTCSQPELADAIGVSRSYINLIENVNNSCNLQHAEEVVKKAYSQFGAPYEDVTAMQQLTLPALVRNAPADVDPELFSRGVTKSETARRINLFKDEFRLRPPQLAQLFGVSGGHEYVLRTGREHTSPEMRRKVLAIIDRETAKRRAAAHTVNHTPRASPTTPAPVAVAAEASGQDTVMSPAVLVRNVSALINALDFDFKTRHQFSKLPDGTILVVKEA